MALILISVTISSLLSYGITVSNRNQIWIRANNIIIVSLKINIIALYFLPKISVYAHVPVWVCICVYVGAGVKIWRVLYIYMCIY